MFLQLILWLNVPDNIILLTNLSESVKKILTNPIVNINFDHNTLIKSRPIINNYIVTELCQTFSLALTGRIFFFKIKINSVFSGRQFAIKDKKRQKDKRQNRYKRQPFDLPLILRPLFLGQKCLRNIAMTTKQK